MTPEWAWERPATTVCADPRVFPPGHFHRRDDDPDNSSGAGENGHPYRATIAELAALQTFPPDYPFAGAPAEQVEQCGNAIPPQLAEAILRALTT